MFDTLLTVNALVGILGGILAISGLILTKKPDAKKYIDRLTPYQALIGVGMIALGVINFLRALGHIGAMLKVGMFGLGWLALVVTSILLGALFGMPQIAKWIPGESSAEQKAVELSKKVAPYQVMLGIILVIASLITMLYMFKILKIA